MDDRTLAALYPSDVPTTGADKQTATREPALAADEAGGINKTVAALYPDDAPSATREGQNAEASAAAPERYDLKLEGVQLDPTLLAEAEPVFRELGLSNKQANALLPIAPKLIESAENAVIERLIDQGAKQRKDWLNAFVNDREIGGANRGESERLAQRGMEVMGFGKDHPFRKALNESGFGNHPDMIRLLRRIGSTEAPGGGGGQKGWESLYKDG